MAWHGRSAGGVREAQGEFRRAASRVYDTDLRYTTPETIAAERANIRHMRDGQGAVEPMMMPKLAEEHAAARTLLNTAQRTVVEEVLTSRDRIHGLQGLAGTGKTSLLWDLRDYEGDLPADLTRGLAYPSQWIH